MLAPYIQQLMTAAQTTFSPEMVEQAIAAVTEEAGAAITALEAQLQALVQAEQAAAYYGMTLSDITITPGLVDILYLGVKLGIYPPLIFLGIGTMTDFEPLIARPSSLLLGAAAQLGIFFTFVGAKSWASPTRKPLPSASSAVPMARPLSSSPPAWPRTCWVPSRLPRTATWRWCLLSSRPS